MKRKIFVLIICFICCALMVSFTACQEKETETTTPAEEPIVEEVHGEMKMNVQVGDHTFTATLEDNEAADELIAMMEDGPVSINMSDYSGFEKVGALGTSLTTSDSQMTASSGDIVLYNENNIVIFYGSNSWSYTKLGRIDDLTGWREALGDGDITVTFTSAE